MNARNLAIVGMLFISTLAFADRKDPPIGKIVSLTGKVWASADPKGETKKELNAGSPLYRDDYLIIGPDSQAQAILGNQDAAILLKKDSVLQINSTPDQNWTLDLKQGMLLTHVKPITSRTHRFQVRTRSATMGVRGTTFFIKAPPEKDVFLCTCDGIVSVDDKALIIGKHHNAPKTIQSGKNPISKRLKNAEVGQDHLDTEAEALTKLLLGGK